jgi:peptidoglycan hydrolase-like protein with peptidoglycan-binding domain
MKRRFLLALSLVALALPVTLAPSVGATTLTLYKVTPTTPAVLAPNLPLLRLYFNAPTRASELPPLVTNPVLSSRWEQIGPNEVQAITKNTLKPSTTYTLSAPTSMRCSSSCSFGGVQQIAASESTSLTWEAQLLAELHYLPLTFTPSTIQSYGSEQVAGTFTWSFAKLPPILSSQWSLGSNNIILRAALMTFQSQKSLPVTGEADAATWLDLVNAANTNTIDPVTYDYVDVSKQLPETLTLYVNGTATFHTLVNTGIPVSPTATGTYAVYLRYLTQTMKGVNPNGQPYSDSGIPDVSYFNGGDALHGFIRASYGFPQSLGCVEMPFASAKIVFPYTPIGTLVTVHS